MLIKDRINRAHSMRYLKNTFNSLELDEKHDLPEDVKLLASIANSLLDIADGVHEMSNSLKLEEGDDSGRRGTTVSTH